MKGIKVFALRRTLKINKRSATIPNFRPKTLENPINWEKPVQIVFLQGSQEERISELKSQLQQAINELPSKK